MNVHAILRLLLLFLLALGQVWGTSVLLVVRGTETLVLCSIVAGVFWLWGAWYSFLRQRRVDLVLTSLYLLLTLAVLGLCVLELGDVSDLMLFDGYR